MTIDFQTLSSGDVASSSATTTVSAPSGTVATDVLVCVIAVASATATITPPAGWTIIGAQVNNGALSLAAFRALGNVAAFGFTTTAGASLGWAVGRFSGVDNTTPIDVAGTSGISSVSTTVTAPSITIATTNAIEVIVIADLKLATYSATGFTNEENAHANQSAAFLYNPTGLATGATGTVTCTSTVGGTGQRLNALPFALRPAAGTAYTLAMGAITYTNTVEPATPGVGMPASTLTYTNTVEPLPMVKSVNLAPADLLYSVTMNAVIFATNIVSNPSSNLLLLGVGG